MALFNLEFGGWFHYAENIKTQTHWQALHAAHRKTAVVSWPVTVGADMDDLLPEYCPVRTDDGMARIRVLSTASLLSGMQKIDATARPMTAEWRIDADPANRIAQVDMPEERRTLGADPAAFLALESVKRFGSGGHLSGRRATDSIRKGEHGYNSQLPEMRSSRILSGAAVTRCSALEGASVEDIGSTGRGASGRCSSEGEGSRARCAPLRSN
jgi:hypothetical protein